MKELIYNPDPEPVLEPLFERHSLDEVEWSDLYEVTCNGVNRRFIIPILFIMHR